MSGQGLDGMRQRLAELGGELDIDRSEGWRVDARLPLPRVPQVEPEPAREQASFAGFETRAREPAT